MEKVIEYTITEGMFLGAFGRNPKSESEFRDFARYCEKGLDSQIDWDIVISTAKEATEKDYPEESNEETQVTE